MNQVSVVDRNIELYDRFGACMGELGRTWRTRMDRRLKRRGLSYVQWSVLRSLSCDGDGRVQKDLAHAVGIDGPGLVGVLDRLVGRNLVERREAQHDRRFKTVHLTDQARDLLTVCDDDLHLLRVEMLKDMDPAEIEGAIELLTKILASMSPEGVAKVATGGRR